MEDGYQPGARRGAIPLDDPEAVWSVRSGYVDIFSIARGADGRSDRPLHHARIAAGGVIFGLPSHTEGGRTLSFAARPGPDAVIVPEPPRRTFLAQAVRDVDDTTGKRHRIEDWAGAIGGGRRDDGAQAVTEALRSGRTDDVEEALEHLHRAVLQRAQVQRELRNEREATLLSARARRDALALEDALLSVAASGSGGEPRSFSHAGPVDDPLLRAAAMAANPMGIVVNPPPDYRQGWRDGWTLEEAVMEIARASQARVRPVTLRGRWWTEDHGPLLGFEKKDRPVALLPSASGTYTLHDPDRPAPLPVNQEVAARLVPRAYSWYAALPYQAVKPWDLIAFAFARRRRDITAALLFGLVGGVPTAIIPLAAGWLFDQVIPHAQRGELGVIAATLVAASLAALLFQLNQVRAAVRIDGWTAATTQAAVWDRLLNLPMVFFRGFTVGDLAQRALKSDDIRRSVFMEATGLLFSLIVAATNAAVLLIYSARLAAAAFALVAFAACCTVGVGFHLGRLHRERLTLQARLSGRVFEIVEAIAKLRTAGAQARAFWLWAKPFSAMRRVAVRVRQSINVLTTFHSVYPLFATTALYLYYYSQPGNLSPGRFLAFSTAFAVLLASLHDFSRFVVSTAAVVPEYHQVRPILEATPEGRDPARHHPGPLRGEIELSRVYFAYDEEGPVVLKDVSFRVAPGEFVAIVGPSGSGKSTLLRIIAGFERPTSGAVYFDGQDLETLDPQAVRAQMGIVPQDGTIMSGDIFTNIAGSARITLDDAWEAARGAGLDEDIRALPMGMHTYVTEATFSGGQRQRLLVARALARKPRILLFDEATSAMDNRTQDIVRASTEHLKATRIVVAHRLSTVVHADRIYVLDQGRIVESGTYEELMARGGLFAQLAQRQLL